jgi:hypothetical protein
MTDEYKRADWNAAHALRLELIAALEAREVNINTTKELSP